MRRLLNTKNKRIIKRVSLTLFFCLISVYAFAATPTLGTITPSSGSTAPDIAKTFTTTYSDADGWANLKEAYLLINTASTAFINTAYLYYDQNANLLYLRNDANTAWLGGYAPTTTNIIENSYVKLNCALTTVSGSSNTITVNWNLTFKAVYSGKTYNTYLKVVDDTGGSVNWSKKGTYTVNNKPIVGTITPSLGTGQVNTPQTFTATYSDPDGWQNIQYVYFLMSTSSSNNANCLYAYYNQNTNLLYLRNDASTAWLGGYAPGTGNVIENSYAKLDCALTQVSGSDTTLTVIWFVVIKAPFSGTKNTYLYVKDDVNAYAGYTQKGTWIIPNQNPSVGTITPSSGNSSPNQAITFTTSYSDPDSWLNIQYAYLLINTYANNANCFYAYYHPVNNKLYLRNDANTSWLGGYAPGSNNIISNSYASLDCSNTTVSGSGANLSITWPVTFKDKSSSRTNNTYLYVQDNAGKYQGWTKKGTWTILSSNPQNKIPLEAELATLVNPFTLGSDTNASSGQYIQILNGSGSNITSPGGPGVASFSFTVAQEDNYNVWARIIAPTSNDDSFFVQIDAGPVQYWVTPLGSNWQWGQVKDSTKGAFYTRLTPGTHTLYFRQREDGPKLDRVIIVNDPLFVPGPGDVTGPDTTPPTGTIKINNDSQYSQTTAVTLNLSAADSGSGMGTGAQMQFSNDNLNWSTPEAYAATKSWVLLSPDTTKTVYVKFKDVAGNWSGAFSDTIILDTTPPSVSINPVVSPTNQNVILSYSATDNLTPSAQIVVTGDNSPYFNEGIYNITLTAQDLAGNTSNNSVSFTIDKTAPVVVITSPTNGAIVEDSTIQLQGTVDGVAFSEPRTLVAGDNTLTKTATDATGNTASASANVYLYLGQLIGPAGGEVLSADGKVKVVIPAGALSSPQQIKVLTVSKETLESAAPTGTSLLSVVECKPYGLVFNQPVSIIYTLYQAEVPGTPVELGFYDAVQKKIISTGQTSTVPADGYTLSFSIMHFSTYAALKNLIPQSTPIGAGVKIPLPDLLTGSFSHAIPITVASGRKGIQPALALNYRSSNANSWVGLGFSLNPGYIVRSTRLGPPTYNDTQDTFYFITDAGTTELVHLVDNLYQAKVESSFTKFFKEPDDTWRVVGKDGGVLRFGQATDAKEGSIQGTFSWYITKAVDTNGNYLEYYYTKDQGKSYLSRIDYTGNEIGISPTNSVEFFLEGREDISSSYITSGKIATAKRLKEIQVKVNSDLVWKYILGYAYSPDTGRSLLSSITQLASDNKSLPVQSFTYQKAK